MPGLNVLFGSKPDELKNALFRLMRGHYRVQAGPFCLILSIILATLYNIPFWKSVIAVESGAHSPANILFLTSFWVLITALLNILINIFCAKFILKPVAIFIVLSASIALYFIYAYGVMIDRFMIENVIETDMNEIRDLLNPEIFVFVFLAGLIPALLIAKIKITYYGFVKQLSLNLLNMAASLIVSVAIMFAFYADFASISQNHRYLRSLLIPSSYLNSTAAYFRHQPALAGPLIAVGADAAKAVSWDMHARKSVTVLVVGETARARNFGFYGYTRDTTPSLEREDIIAFKEFYSCGTSTAVSLPCMFSILTRKGFNKSEALRHENVLDIISRSGIQVIWRDNNSGCKGVCDRVEFQDFSRLETGSCNSEECYDEVLLTDLGSMIDQLDHDLFIVLHQKGSHGPAYYKRVPEEFERFGPACKDPQLKNCTQQEIVNAYDNSILYTDHVLNRIIDFLKSRERQYDTALIYVSDHGESLGEGNLYLHGAPYALAPEEQTHIPFFIWLSEGYISDFELNEKCLRQKSDEMYSHDNLFHSLLGLLDIVTADYDKNLDITACP
jgi:lipid A ethanolaminephosphotransferase